MSEEKKKQALDKSEKNIRRRVYDALNVQFAACVLQKKDKFIMPNYSSPIFQRIYNYLYGDELQSVEGVDEDEYKYRHNRKSQRKVQFAPNGDSCEEHEKRLDMDMIEKKRQKLEYLKKKLHQRQMVTENKTEQLHEKRHELCQELKQMICYQKLIYRNKQRVEYNQKLKRENKR